MIASTPFTGKRQTVEDQWTDYNGHLNMAYYAVMFDRNAEEMFEVFGLGPDYLKETSCSIFTLETHTTYANELHAGEDVRIETQIIGADAKRIHYVQQMFRADSTYLACVLEVMVSHIDLGAKRTSPFPPDIQLRVDEMAKSHQSLPLPPQVGHVIALPPKRG